MILIIDNKSLGHVFSFNMKEGDLIQDLIDSFIENKGEELFNLAELILIRHQDFYYIIKNIYGNLQATVLLSDITPIINLHLNT